ncbi:MAG: hypothetical protein PHW31_00175 [Candidatus Pacebacteria bacterium]|nr:hypothetical protein [Candidatus Paceibacterota bacterium]
MALKIKENNLINISKKMLEIQGGAVVLGLNQYKEFLKYQMEKEYVDKIVREGLDAKNKGKTETMEAFLKKSYPQLYADYKN